MKYIIFLICQHKIDISCTSTYTSGLNKFLFKFFSIHFFYNVKMDYEYKFDRCIYINSNVKFPILVHFNALHALWNISTSFKNSMQEFPVST